MAGRPPKYKTPEELEKKFAEYLEDCEANSLNLTITGACLFLGFCSRQSFYAYGEKPEFNYTIKKIHLHIENSYEQKLDNRFCTGAIFALKNLQWKDTQDITSKGESISPVNIVVDSKGTADSLKKLIDGSKTDSSIPEK